MKIKSLAMTFGLLSILLLNNGCGGGGSNQNSSGVYGPDTNISIQTQETEIGKISVYAKKRTTNSLVAETRVESQAGIEKITLYCIDAYKYLEEKKLLILAQSSKSYNPGETKIEFYQHTFKNLYPQKAYILKAVAETEAGTLHQQTIVATLPLPMVKESINIAPYNNYHPTKQEYYFSLNKPTYVKTVTIDEFDGDLGTMDVFLKADDGSLIQIGNNVITSGDGVNKVTKLSNPNQNKLIKAVVIRPDNSLGGMWQINSIVIN